MSSVASLADLLRQDRPVITAWCGLPDATPAAILAREAFDAVTFDMQHGAIDFTTVVQAIPVVGGVGKPAAARIPVGAFATASRLLDAGASAIIAPMINTLEDARRLVSFVKFPPVGERSWGPHGALGLSGLAPPDYFKAANGFTLAFAMVETREALDIVDEVLGVPGLDGIFIGPSDLSIGLSGGGGLAPTGPEVNRALDHAHQRAKAAGKLIGVYAASGERAAEFAGMGFNLIALASDTAFLRAGAQAALKAARAGATA